jgi:hypothetical protein
MKRKHGRDEAEVERKEKRVEWLSRFLIRELGDRIHLRKVLWIWALLFC